MRLNTLCIVSHAVHHRPLLVVDDFVIDGSRLLDHIERAAKRTFDLVSPFGWMPADYLRSYAARLMADEKSILPSGRYELLVCPECGHLGCGCVSCVVAREGDQVIWSEFGWETDYEPDGVSLFPMGNFRFSSRALAGVLGSPGIV